MKPCGEAGKARLIGGGYGRGHELPETITIARVKTHPWFIIAWEKLNVQTPPPKMVQPYCCYIRTIYFYHKPYKVKPGERSFIDYGKVEHFLTCDDRLTFEGEEFEIGTGRVVRYRGSWYFVSWARRQKIDKTNGT